MAPATLARDQQHALRALHRSLGDHYVYVTKGCQYPQLAFRPGLYWGA